MAWIQVIDETQATGDVLKVYEAVRAELGRLSPMLQAMSLRPEALRAVHDLSRVIHFGHTSLGRRAEQMLALVVSATNGCRY